MDDSWLEAARRYGTFNDRTRADYWSQLNPEQQNLLMEALAALTAKSQEAATSGLQAPVQAAVAGTPKPRSLFGRMAIGCGWMFLGGVLTVALEIAAVSKGIDVLSGIFRDTSSNYQMNNNDYDQVDCGVFLRDDPDQYSYCMSIQRGWREQEEHNRAILQGE